MADTHFRRARPASAVDGLRRGERSHPTLFANNRHGKSSPMWRAPVFKEKDSLPCSELHFSIGNRYCLARASQHHPDMRRHVVAPFGTVCEVIGIFGHEPIEKRFQIAAGGRIGILHHDDTATGVLNEHSHCPVPYSAPVDLRLHIIGDFVEALAVRANFELVVADAHR